MHRFPLLSWAIVLTLATASCGTEDDDPDTGSDATATADAAGTDTATTSATTAGPDATSDTGLPSDATVAGDTAVATDTGATTAPGDVAADVVAGEGFDAIFEVFVGAGCTAGYCHGAGQGGLSMTNADDAYTALVDVNATTAVCGISTRIVAGDPEQSILWQRVRSDGGEPSPDCAPKMPAGSMGLDATQAELIEAWIAAGAPR